MKIGIISDTHINKHIDQINTLYSKYLKDMDMIIHVGDFKSLEVVTRLKQMKKFVGVWGNNDGENIRKILNEKEIIFLYGYKIGLFHGHGTSNTTIERAYDKFKEDNVDIIIFGHSHQPVIKTKDKILMLNPGSLTRKGKERWHSYIVMEIEKHKVNVELKLIE